jgi:hypothetical protein
MLRGWLPNISRELEHKGLLTCCYTADCSCTVLIATSADLDAIVEYAQNDGLIAIQKETA